uniref:Uncharacterized protein n=1 Tax=Oryza nivara TaxID=4536 RepID=A0A0E0HWJ4_ORYNI
MTGEKKRWNPSKSPSLLRRSWFEPEAQRRRRRRRRIGRGGGDGDGDGGASQGDARRIRRRCGTGGRRTPLEGSRYPGFLPPLYGRSRGCSNGGGRCAKVADLAEMNGRINMVEFELKREVQLMKFAVEKQRAMARVEMMEAEANRMQFRFRLMCGLVWGGSLVYIASHRY